MPWKGMLEQGVANIYCIKCLRVISLCLSVINKFWTAYIINKCLKIKVLFTVLSDSVLFIFNYNNKGDIKFK